MWYDAGMVAKPQTIEGTWEEVLARGEELAGRRVRVIVLGERPAEGAKMSDDEQAELRKRAEAWLEETEKLVREPSNRPPTEFEQILIEKMRKQGIEVE